MNDSIVAPGITLHSSDAAGSRYIGELDAFIAAGMVPAGTADPREQSGGKGVRWRDAEGRRYVLSKPPSWHSGVRLAVYVTAAERSANEAHERRQRRLAKIDDQIALCAPHEEDYRRDCLMALHTARSILTSVMFDRQPLRAREQLSGFVWSFPKDMRDEVNNRLAEIEEMILEVPLVADRSRLRELTRERSALCDPALQRFLDGVRQ